MHSSHYITVLFTLVMWIQNRPTRPRAILTLGWAPCISGALVGPYGNSASAKHNNNNLYI